MVSALGGEATLSELRRVGETLAAQYPGYQDMGMSPVKQASYDCLSPCPSRPRAFTTGNCLSAHQVCV